MRSFNYRSTALFGFDSPFFVDCASRGKPLSTTPGPIMCPIKVLCRGICLAFGAHVRADR